MANLSIEKHPQYGYLLHSEGIVPRPLEEVFGFFSDAANLQRLTPPWLERSSLTSSGIRSVGNSFGTRTP